MEWRGARFGVLYEVSAQRKSRRWVIATVGFGGDASETAWRVTFATPWTYATVASERPRFLRRWERGVRVGFNAAHALTLYLGTPRKGADGWKRVGKKRMRPYRRVDGEDVMMRGEVTVPWPATLLFGMRLNQERETLRSGVMSARFAEGVYALRIEVVRILVGRKRLPRFTWRERFMVDIEPFDMDDPKRRIGVPNGRYSWGRPDACYGWSRSFDRDVTLWDAAEAFEDAIDAERERNGNHVPVFRPRTGVGNGQ